VTTHGLSPSRRTLPAALRVPSTRSTGASALRRKTGAGVQTRTSRTPSAIAASLAGAELVDFAVDDVCDTAEGSGLAAQPPPPAKDGGEQHHNDDQADNEDGQQMPSA
jgi:hypothetical protein